MSKYQSSLVNEVLAPAKATCGRTSLVIRTEPTTGMAALLVVSGQRRQRNRSQETCSWATGLFNVQRISLEVFLTDLQA